MAADLVVLGVASSASSHHAVRELAPHALRRAGLLDRPRSVGRSVDHPQPAVPGVTVADPALTEVNPGHDPDGREAFR
jgi:hypothetical protein